MKEALTDKELEALELFAQGYSAKAAGKLLWISESAAKSRAQNARKKLKAKNMPHAISIAYQRGILKVKNDENIL